jgi:hypothetical protein
MEKNGTQMTALEEMRWNRHMWIFLSPPATSPSSVTSPASMRIPAITMVVPTPAPVTQSKTEVYRRTNVDRWSVHWRWRHRIRIGIDRRGSIYVIWLPIRSNHGTSGKRRCEKCHDQQAFHYWPPRSTEFRYASFPTVLNCYVLFQCVSAGGFMATCKMRMDS